MPKPWWALTFLLAACGGSKTPSSAAVARERPLTTTEPAPAPIVPTSKARVTVTCGFSPGWAAVFPKGTVDPQRDEYAMQALIGLTQDPDFWASESDYGDLAPWAAQRCDGDRGATFEVPPGELVILTGLADGYDAKGGGYQNNGALRELTVHAGERDRQHFERGDLVLDFPCISCPWLEVWDPVARGWDRRVEILVDLYSPARARAQHRAIGKVRVDQGRVRLRIAEDDDEISHLSALTLVLGEHAFAARVPRTITLNKGDRRELSIPVTLPNGEYDAEVIATGYYVPLGALHRP